ncbi:MAG: YqgE/AlgH family protein [Hyphomicrobiales bacterium]|nr:YqgE/AlgH family protein [Hyphomicrobiales bacterium]
MTTDNTKLNGRLLIAMPQMQDTRFQRSVIYMCFHNTEGAFGLVINKQVENLTFPILLKQLSITPSASDAEALLERPILLGGPVETGRGFVLHSSDYTCESATVRVSDDVSLTGTTDALKAMAAHSPPKHALFALGYAGWGAGQLESEIQANGWLHCDADLELVFDNDLESKYARALDHLGVDIAALSGNFGNA